MFILKSLRYQYFKSILDRAVALVALLILWPILLLLILLVWRNFGFPIFYRQLRPGHNSRPFNLLKLRTMTSERDSRGFLLPDHKRLTPFGRWLRSTSLDELPELVNIINGDMSFVGPRPLLMQYLSLYSPEQLRRHSVKPGLSGWAQINGRNAISWEQKFELDVWYVDHQSFLLDLYILFITIYRVIRRDGIGPAGEVTMPYFTGSVSSPSEPY